MPHLPPLPPHPHTAPLHPQPGSVKDARCQAWLAPPPCCQADTTSRDRQEAPHISRRSPATWRSNQVHMASRAVSAGSRVQSAHWHPCRSIASLASSLGQRCARTWPCTCCRHVCGCPSARPRTERAGVRGRGRGRKRASPLADHFNHRASAEQCNCMLERAPRDGESKLPPLQSTHQHCVFLQGLQCFDSRGASQRFITGRAAYPAWPSASHRCFEGDSDCEQCARTQTPPCPSRHGECGQPRSPSPAGAWQPDVTRWPLSGEQARGLCCAGCSGQPTGHGRHTSSVCSVSITYLARLLFSSVGSCRRMMLLSLSSVIPGLARTRFLCVASLRARTRQQRLPSCRTRLPFPSGSLAFSPTCS